MRAFASVLVMTCLSLAAASWAAPLVTSDNFSDGDYTANPAWTANAGTWSASSGQLRQTQTGIIYAHPPKMISLDGVTETTPYTTIIADMRIETAGAPGNDAVGIAFRMQSPNDMYAIYFFPDWAPGNGDLQLVRIQSSGSYTIIGGPLSMGFHPDAANSTMTLEIQPLNQFKVTVQSGANSYSHTFTDSALTNGGIGLFNRVAFSGDAGVFDNVAVYVPEPASAAALVLPLLLRRKRRPQ